jgi:uncharacterized protein YggE
MKRIALVVAGLLAGAVLALQVPSIAQTDGDSTAPDRTITVTGSATIRTKPDQATVSLGVQTQADTAQGALTQNAEKMNAVLDALKAMGFGDSALATTDLGLDPMWSNDGRTVVGFQAHNQVSVTIRDLSKVGPAIDAAVHAGANLAGGIQFGLSDENAGVDDALAQAVEDARAKADVMAGAASASVGEVVTITETATPGPMPYYAGREAVAYAVDAATPINPGPVETQVSVTVTWALG